MKLSKKKFQGFHPWQLGALLIAALGAVVAVVGGIAAQLGILVTGLAVAVLSTTTLVLLVSRQTWRQLKKLDRSVNQVAAEGLATVYVPATDDNKPASVGQARPQIGLDHEWARRMPHIRPSFETFVLRSKSVRARDALALAATARTYRYGELRELLAVMDTGVIEKKRFEMVRKWDQQMLLTLARLAANQRQLESDIDDAQRLFSLVERYFGTKALGRNDRLIYIEILGESGESKRQREAIKRFSIKNKFPVQADLLRLNSVLHIDGQVTDRWVGKLNEMYKASGFAPVRLISDPNLVALDRLRSDTDKKVTGPKVSVLVPTFRGGELLQTALRSLLQQTWDNLEIIVIDDCSGPEYEEYLVAAENMSPKIRVIRQSQNLGAYCARNAGLTVAQGEFITVHDDDDWSHPEKIEIQVEHLRRHPDVPANMSLHARSTDALKFLRINNNPQFAQSNFSSLMVRRQLFDELGPWDTVNRGADAEFRDRITARFGKTIEAVGQMPMSFTRTRDGSLTAGEMSRGFVDPSRLLYLSSYTKWHGQFKSDPEKLRRSEAREYTVPTTMEAGRRGADLGVYDIVYATDFRFPGGTTTLTLAEMQAIARSGMRVGFIQLDSPLNKPTTPISDKLLSMHASGEIEQISLSDVGHAKVLLVRHPTVVTYLDCASSRLTADHALLVVNNPPVNKGGSGMVFDLVECIENMDRLFDTKTYVIGESELTRKLSVPLVPSSRMAASTWPGVISSSSIPSPDFDQIPVLGRHSRDHALKWPSTATDFRNVYVSEQYRTEILGGSKELTAKLGSDITDGVKVHDFGTLVVDDFLGRVDFWAYFHDDKLTESFGMATAEAMSAGKVVILPRYMESTFGEGAIYAEPSEVPGLIQRYWSDPELYLAQSEKARDYIRSKYGVDALLKRIAQVAESTAV